MKSLCIEMSEVRDCAATSCAYNTGGTCHAKAITVGDSIIPQCDTFFVASVHVSASQAKGGVGACKVSGCRFNLGLECTADSIVVGPSGKGTLCLTYQPARAGRRVPTMQ